MQLASSACLIFILALPIIWVTAYHHETNTSAIDGVNYNRRPCTRAWDNNGYNHFSRKHILSATIDTNSKKSWSRYLDRRRLCGRVRLQSFLQKSDEEAVKSICHGEGLNVQRNLCISQQVFLVFAIQSQKIPRKRCIIRSIQRSQNQVVVACDAIANQCLPVHFEPYRGQVPRRNARVCR